jgi:outer membrane protein TolC
LKFKRLLFSFGVTLLLWIGAVLGYAAEPTPLVGDEALLDVLPEKSLPDLQIALERAMGASSRVIASLLDVDQARVGEQQARSPMLPYASANFNAGLTHETYDYASYEVTGGGIVPSKSETRNVTALLYNAGISQPIFRWGALKKNYQSAQLQKAIASRNVEEIRRTLAIEIRRAYFSLISTANALETEKATLAKMEEERDFLKKQVADGFVIAGAADSAEIRIKDFKLQMERSRNNFETQWLAFCDLTGLDRFTAPPVFPKEIPGIRADLNPVLKKATPHPGQHIPVNLLNAEDAIKTERLNYEIASTRLRPQFGLSLSAAQENRAPDNMVFGPKYLVTSYSSYMTVNWPIFDGFSTQAAKQSSLIRLRQQQRARDQAQKDYDETLKTNVTNLRLNWQSLQRTEEGLTDARRSVETFQKDYEAGMSPKQVWDTAKTAADSALQAANNARADYYLQIVTYLSLRGKDPAVNLVARKQSSDAPKK